MILEMFEMFGKIRFSKKGTWLYQYAQNNVCHSYAFILAQSAAFLDLRRLGFRGMFDSPGFAMFDRVLMLNFLFYIIYVMNMKTWFVEKMHFTWSILVIFLWNFFWLGLYVLTMQVIIKWLIKTKRWVMGFLRACECSPPLLSSPLQVQFGSVSFGIFWVNKESSRLELNWGLQCIGWLFWWFDGLFHFLWTLS